jgi:hypothetical protein
LSVDNEEGRFKEGNVVSLLGVIRRIGQRLALPEAKKKDVEACT